MRRSIASDLPSGHHWCNVGLPCARPGTRSRRCGWGGGCSFRSPGSWRCSSKSHRDQNWAMTAMLHDRYFEDRCVSSIRGLLRRILKRRVGRKLQLANHRFGGVVELLEAVTVACPRVTGVNDLLRLTQADAQNRSCDLYRLNRREPIGAAERALRPKGDHQTAARARAPTPRHGRPAGAGTC